MVECNIITISSIHLVGRAGLGNKFDHNMGFNLLNYSILINFHLIPVVFYLERFMILDSNSNTFYKSK